MVGPFPVPLTALKPPIEGVYSLVAAGAGEVAVGGGTAGEAVLGVSDKSPAVTECWVSTANAGGGCSGFTSVVRGETA